MTAALPGLVWSLLVGWLLRRVLTQFRAHRTATLEVAPPGIVGARVAVIVPARDEAANIGPCLAGLQAQQRLSHPLSIVVVDDESGDGTADRVRTLATLDARIRLISAGTLPTGWLGKPHACWQGAVAAEADWLCFIDADVRAGPLLLASAVAAAEARSIDLLSLQPFQELGSLWERLVIPAGLLMIACAKGVPSADAPDRDLAVNGQVILVRAEVYRGLGGHAAVRGEVCEDNALARRVQRSGYRVRVLAADHLARTRMYRDLASLWEGFSKNAVEIMGSAARTAVAATAGCLVAGAALLLPPWLAAAAWRSPGGPALAGLVLGAGASSVVLGIELGTLRHFRASRLLLPLLPLGFAVAAALAWESIRLRHRGQVRWKGRTYRRPGPRASVHGR